MKSRERNPREWVPFFFNRKQTSTTHSYDDLNRLMSASVTTGGNQYARAWTYDALGNMQTRVEQGATTTYQYNDATSKHAVTQLNNVLKYVYDANGNMITRDGDVLNYDVENRLTSVTKAGVTTTFAYNGDGTRVKRTVSNAGTTYYIGNYFEVYVPNGGSATFNKYYYFGAQRVAAKIASTLFYFQGDHLGSSSVVMTQAGTSFYSRQTYFPYGAQRTTEGSALPIDYTFTGQKVDDSTGLMFYGARYYDTSLGRFIQADTIVPSPLNPQSLNRFSYTYNNPVRYTDPTGHIPCEDPDDCNPGQGGDDQPGDDPNVQPEPPPDYCTVNPYANGCYVPPADSGDNQGPDDDGNCNVAKCNGQNTSTDQETKVETASCGIMGCYQDDTRTFYDPMRPYYSVSIDPNGEMWLKDGLDVIKANVAWLIFPAMGAMLYTGVGSACGITVGIGCPLAVAASIPVGAAILVGGALYGSAVIQLDQKFADEAIRFKIELHYTRQYRMDFEDPSDIPFLSYPH